MSNHCLFLQRRQSPWSLKHCFRHSESHRHTKKAANKIKAAQKHSNRRLLNHLKSRGFLRIGNSLSHILLLKMEFRAAQFFFFSSHLVMAVVQTSEQRRGKKQTSQAVYHDDETTERWRCLIVAQSHNPDCFFFSMQNHSCLTCLSLTLEA